MMADRKWTDLTNQELKTEVIRIANASRSAEEVKRKLEEELGYPYTPAVVYRGAMFMGMMYGKDGTVISF